MDIPFMPSKRELSPEAYARVLAGNRARQKTKIGSANHLKANRAYRERNRQKAYAHGVVAYALKLGNLKKKPCEKCGAKKVEAHHDDYTKPLKVRWLCPKHHREHHEHL